MSQTWKEKITALKASGIELSLETLLALAKTHQMSPEEIEEQRRGYVISELMQAHPEMRRKRAEALYDEAKKKYGL